MALLIWGGAFISLTGLAGLISCIIKVVYAKKNSLSDDELKAVLKNTLPINLVSLFLSFLGLMAVVLGVFLG